MSSALRYNVHTMDEYTPPVLEGGRLLGDEEHLRRLQEYPCMCCPYCWYSICAEPHDDSRCFDHKDED